MKKQIFIFLIRWALNSLGIWVAVRLLGTGYEMTDATLTLATFLSAGLIFSVVNAFLKPIVVILSLPAILLSLGLFTIVVNGLMVYISLSFVPDLSMTFFNSILAGIILSLVNYIIGGVLDA